MDPLKLKIIIIGTSGVGKSSILLSFTTGRFTDKYITTVGVDFECKQMEVDGVKVNVNIWDTAGQDRFKTVVHNFYRDVHGVVLVYDVSKPESLTELDGWLEEFKLYSTKENSVGIVVGNKIDKPRLVPREAGEAFATKHGMIYVETSASKQEGITSAFETLVQKVIQTPELWETGGSSSGIIVVMENKKLQIENYMPQEFTWWWWCRC